ncbi:Receptor-type tyrosine-protein phosphatase F [Geodia barretti]|uniref:protein-tyrosine-phosphatase n=1 Tax=Geodia barretti TaxID=519541 RepID=A0AA35R3A5_GEOBA|nr:Receptor-type tyrosine-protein phosphatase F [Geodia barretti]
MVWDYQIPTIVMLTRCFEDGKEKCMQYWPDQTNTSVTRGKFDITVTSLVPSAEYQIRKMQLKSKSDPEHERTVTHMLYTAWPDHGVPRNAMSLISFIHRVRREHPVSLTTPLLVHCSAGVGRTGTFILLDVAMQQMKREGTLSVFQRLKNMRTQRMKLVQTQAQYVFIHDSLSELVVCGETDVAAGNIRIRMMQLQKPVPGDPSGLIGFQKQFETLEEVSSQCEASYQEAKAKYNAGKNRFPDKLPNELGRVRLRFGPKPGSDYINASFIDGYKQRKAYIATQGPMEGTVADLWRMIWEHNCSCIVMLCQTQEKGQVSSHCFWPEGEKEEAVYGKLRVGVKRVSHHGDIIERKLEVEDTEGRGGVQKTVSLMQLSSWPPGELPHPTAILSLVDLLTKAQRGSPGRHTVIMCSDGVGRTGTFICIHSQLERLKTEGVVDFFQAAKSARIQRAALVPDAEAPACSRGGQKTGRG